MPTTYPASPIAKAPSQPARIRLDAHELMHKQSEIEIVHGTEIYRLRMTRNGKLILTK